eukprot:TRINITY_DN13696_c0_g1_i1.p1 TRINITY_DN13696_c0_g1~~TRINITY_DN13696_c0_g1_i1.p1  ORF type:complete len:472 (-),score=81.58 TRINITY_DN13696_c0_g1_i1:24-1439(-)
MKRNHSCVDSEDKNLLDLPLETFQEIFSHLKTFHLVHFTQISKRSREIVSKLIPRRCELVMSDSCDPNDNEENGYRTLIWDAVYFYKEIETCESLSGPLNWIYRINGGRLEELKLIVSKSVMLPSFNNLTKLEVGGRITHLGVPALHSLREISIRGDDIQESIPKDCLYSLFQVGKLEKLYFKGNPWKKFDLSLKNLGDCKSLKSIKIKHVDLTKDDLIEISQKCQQLEVLELDHCFIHSHGIVYDQSVLIYEYFPQISSIFVYNPYEVHDETIPKLGHLTRLKIHCSVSHEYPFEQLFSVVKGLKLLKSLYIHNIHYDSITVEQLQRLLKCFPSLSEFRWSIHDDDYCEAEDQTHFTIEHLNVIKRECGERLTRLKLPIFVEEEEQQVKWDGLPNLVDLDVLIAGSDMERGEKEVIYNYLDNIGEALNQLKILRLGGLSHDGYLCWEKPLNRFQKKYGLPSVPKFNYYST